MFSFTQFQQLTDNDYKLIIKYIQTTITVDV